MTQPLTVEQMVRKCFDNSVVDCVTYTGKEAMELARCARKFVAMERKQVIGRMLKASGKITRDEVTACRKTRRAR